MREKIDLGLTNANVVKRSYFFNKILIRRGVRLININSSKYRGKKELPAKYSRIVILMRPNNTFISLNNRGETYKLITAGLVGFEGPKRSSPYSRHVVARIISRYIYKQGYENIDIYFNSRITRRFYFLFKGLIIRPYNVRYIARNKMVSHGFMRRKKKKKMIDKVNDFPIERFYFLESEDFLVHREKNYFKKNKTIKLNSYWLGVSKLRINNDKMLYLFNGLRGYYDVRSRYFKEPKLMESRVPLSKRIFVNDYLIKKYKFSDMLIYSLNTLDRPTITLKRENVTMYYSFPYRLVDFLNQKREILNARKANDDFYKNVKELKNIGYNFFIKPRKKYKGFNRMEYIPSVVLGFTEIFLVEYLYYLTITTKQREKAVKLLCIKKSFFKPRRKKRKLRFFQKFYKGPKALKFLFVISRKYLNQKYWYKRRERLKKFKL